MKRVLLIATQYPRPGAATRTAGLVKYLPRFGWTVSMITTARPRLFRTDADIVEVPSRDHIEGMKSRAGIKPGESTAQRMAGPSSPNRSQRTSFIVRTGKSILAYPDEQRGWMKPATEAATELVRDRGPDAVLSSSPGVSSHVVAARVVKESGLPWVADLRDLWSENPYSNHLRIRKAMDRRLEARTLQHAAWLTTISPELAESLRRTHLQPVSVITNGFDPDQLRPDDVGARHPFTIAHTGGLYQGKRDPGPLLVALREMIKDKEIARESVRVDFYGPHEPWLDQKIARLGLGGIVSQHGPVNATETIDAQRSAQLLLLLTWDDPADRGTCPVKLFEYMAARRPVLSLGYRQSAGSRIVEECGLGRAFSSNEGGALRSFLREQIGKATHADLSTTLNTECADRYTHLEMARKVAEILERVSDDKASLSA